MAKRGNRAQKLDWRSFPALAQLGWGSFARVLVAVAAGLTALLFGFVLLTDPYGLRTRPGVPAAAILDGNQRFMYPRIVRSRIYDSAVFGTSTSRLLDPATLDLLFGGRFANLAMDAATPWEQIELMRLFLRETPAPRMLIVGLDPTWCAQDADAPGNRLTFRAFPPWLYDDTHLGDERHLLNLKSLEIAARTLMHKVGLLPERIRGDGYAVFTPPEGSYDAQRASLHIWNGPPQRLQAVFPRVELTQAERDALRFPAVKWLAETLARLPDSAGILLTFPPVHVAEQPMRGSRAAAIEAQCKGRLAAIARNRNGVLADFRVHSNVTIEDTNYWDPLHYRLPIAAQFAQALREAQIGVPASDGFYEIRTGTPQDW